MDNTTIDKKISSFANDWYLNDIQDFPSTLKIGLTKEILSSLLKKN